MARKRGRPRIHGTDERKVGRPKKWSVQLEKYIKELGRNRYDNRYLDEIRLNVSEAFQFWGEPKPKTITEEDVLDYLEILENRGVKDVTKKNYWGKIKGFLEYCGHRVPALKRYRWRDDGGQNVNWLTESEMDKVLYVEKDPWEDIAVHLTLELGIRFSTSLTF